MDSYINFLNAKLDEILSIGRSIDNLDEYEFDRFELLRLLLIKYLQCKGLSYDLDPETYRPINIEDKGELYYG